MLNRTLFPFALAVLGVTPLAAQDAPASSDMQDLLELLNTPVVSASKTAEKLSEAPATIIVISKKDIERRGYTEFREIFDDLPGFDTMTTFGDTFVKSYARGYRNNIGDSFLIMVDGRVFNHLWFNTTDSASVALPLSNIERVEVVYGPASSLYGANAFMGVINVITGKGLANTTHLNASLMGGDSRHKGVDVTWRQNNGTWGYSLTARRYEGDVEKEVLDRYEYTSTKFYRDFMGRSMYGNLLKQYGGDGNIPWKTTAYDLRL